MGHGLSEEASVFEQAADGILAAVRSLVAQPVLIGIAGPPGSGKSTLAEAAVRAADSAALVPMDGFHLSNRQLTEQGLADVKGAPQTFDRDGLRAQLSRLGGPGAVYFPDFSHERHEPIAASIRIDPGTKIVVVEGNYLLLDAPGWREIAAMLDFRVFIDVPWPVCRQRLIPRHTRAGKSDLAAVEWVDRSDRANYDLVVGLQLPADMTLHG